MPSIAESDVLDRLEARLRSLRPDSPRRWGSLTPAEMLCHLGDAATNVVGRRGALDGESRPLRKWVGLRSGIPWPHGAETAAQNNPRLDGTKPGDFELDREHAIRSLRNLISVEKNSFPGSHAVFGVMSYEDWLYWAYKHTDHHLSQFGV